MSEYPTIKPEQMMLLKDTPVDWEDRSFHKYLTCVNHPRNIYSTKNPWDRSIFILHPGYDCDCPTADLRYIREDRGGTDVRCNCENSKCSHVKEGEVCMNDVDGITRVAYLGTVCTTCKSNY